MTKMEYIPDAKDGDIVPATVFAIEFVEASEYGDQYKWKLVQADGRVLVMWTPATLTPRNRLGRTVVRLLGELRSCDSDDFIGMTVDTHYRDVKDGIIKIDLLTPRKPAKGEDVTATVKAAQEAEAQRDDTSAF